jgi:membrane-bound lytic murein transglycosylase A
MRRKRLLFNGGSSKFEYVLAVVLTLSLLANPLLSSCAQTDRDLIAIEPGTYPFFIDDGSAVSLIEAIDRHLSYLDKSSIADSVVATTKISQQEFARSLTTFKSLLLTSPDPIQLNQLIRNHFQLYKSKGRDDRQQMLVTAYYEPIFDGSLRKTEIYRYPVYRVPDSLIHRSKGQVKVGRLDAGGRLVPFWTRREIETQNLLHGSELVYLKDRLDCYLLHVQGSGRVRLPDGSVKALHFGASNGLTYSSLGKLFVDEGIMSAKEVSIDSIRRYFTGHPEAMDRMLFHNPRYIFFNWGDDQGPRGSLGQVLTANRSIAVDHEIFPTGAIGYLVSRRPVLDDDGSINHWKLFGRFVLPQDSGAAIKGPGRVDLFLGHDYYAEKAAGNMKESGSLFFLLPKSTIDKTN